MRSDRATHWGLGAWHSIATSRTTICRLARSLVVGAACRRRVEAPEMLNAGILGTPEWSGGAVSQTIVFGTLLSLRADRRWYRSSGADGQVAIRSLIRRSARADRARRKAAG